MIRKSFHQKYDLYSTSDHHHRIIAQECTDIKNEFQSNDLQLQIEAVLKCIYLHTRGIDMTWASVYIVRVMSFPLFAQRHIGFIAASLIFPSSPDFALLTTHFFRKLFQKAVIILNHSESTSSISTYHDMQCDNIQYDLDSALCCLAQIITPEMARELLNDTFKLIYHPRTHVRTRALCVLYRIFLSWPYSLRLVYPSLKNMLNDTDSSVLTATVIVFCELIYKNPKGYLSLIPAFFSLFVTTIHPLTTIKLLKIFSWLIPLEPRLSSKLIDHISKLFSQTNLPLSIEYECINTMFSTPLDYISSLSESRRQLIQVLLNDCKHRLVNFLHSKDPNILYMALNLVKKLAIHDIYFISLDKIYNNESIKDTSSMENSKSRLLSLLFQYLSSDCNSIRVLVRSIIPLVHTDLLPYILPQLIQHLNWLTSKRKLKHYLHLHSNSKHINITNIGIAEIYDTITLIINPCKPLGKTDILAPFSHAPIYFSTLLECCEKTEMFQFPQLFKSISKTFLDIFVRVDGARMNTLVQIIKFVYSLDLNNSRLFSSGFASILSTIGFILGEFSYGPNLKKIINSETTISSLSLKALYHILISTGIHYSSDVTKSIYINALLKILINEITTSCPVSTSIDSDMKTNTNDHQNDTILLKKWKVKTFQGIQVAIRITSCFIDDNHFVGISSLTSNLETKERATFCYRVLEYIVDTLNNYFKSIDNDTSDCIININNFLIDLKTFFHCSTTFNPIALDAQHCISIPSVIKDMNSKSKSIIDKTDSSKTKKESTDLKSISNIKTTSKTKKTLKKPHTKIKKVNKFY